MHGSFKCTCLEGWGGPTCAQNLDDCFGQCLNGATCIDLVNNYHCACAVGYSGNTTITWFSITTNQIQFNQLNFYL